MAMKIRCTDCTKKIMIDEAFAGGVCRCPYCKAIVFVADRGAQGGASSRPGAPPARPQAPTARPEAPVTQAEAAGQAAAEAGAPGQEEYIPTAAPVRIQGIVSIVLLGLILVMVVGMIWLAYKLFGPGAKKDAQGPQGSTQQAIPMTGGAKVSGPVVGEDVKVDSPVIYCIDAGSAMGTANVFNYAEAMTRSSVKSLKEGQQFNVLLCREQDGEEKFIQEDYLTGGKDAWQKVEKFLGEVAPEGASNLPRALKKAIEKRPRMIVLFTVKNVSDALPVADQAKERGVRIVTIAMQANPDLDLQEDVKSSMAELARKTGGETRALTLSQMDRLVRQAGRN